MECTRFKNCNFCWNRRNKFSILKLDGGYIGNRYLLLFSFSGKLYKKNRERIIWETWQYSAPKENEV